MNYIVTFITFSTYFGSIRTIYQLDNAPHDPNGVESVMFSEDQPRLNMYKDELFNDYNPGNPYIFMADDFGIIHRIDTEDEIEVVPTFGGPVEVKFKFYLYTRINRHVPQILDHGNEVTLIESNFHSGKNTIVIAHGWRGNYQSSMVRVLTRAFLYDEDVNVIVFDWGEIANGYYKTSKARASELGRILGRFVKWLAEAGYTMYSKVHLVGHSLGAHLVGNAGRETGGAVARITAMDPARPFWQDDKDRLVSTDAVYVEVIHTNAGWLGLELPCGDADFYPNGGTKMPGSWPGWYSPYSHSCSWEYMARTLENKTYEAKKCKDYKEMKKNNCNGPTYIMGTSDLHKKGKGIFRLDIPEKCTENK